jgi:uncharacterized membrane protein YdjX (TVP38/TMEM64 family)
MSPEIAVPKKKLPIAKLAVAAVLLLVVAVIFLRGVDLRGLIDRGMAAIRAMGPGVFFAAMAILPAVGAPMAAFTIPAGEAFGERLGMPTVVIIALAVIAFNLAFGYWVARYALRPLLLGLLKRYGYTVPRVTRENALSVALLVRLTPGPPYALQAWILGCAETPFGLYMLVSWLGVLPYALAGIILGKGMFDGNFKAVAGGLGLLVAAAVAVQLVRKKMAKRRES